jgi:adenylosuccinate synthase
MSNIIILGAQWGDEGKGKLVDLLAGRFEYIVRYQGGNNAGHTILIGDRKFVLRLVPSGILHPGKIAVIANGLVVDPVALLEEATGCSRRRCGQPVTHQQSRAGASADAPAGGEDLRGETGQDRDRHYAEGYRAVL